MNRGHRRPSTSIFAALTAVSLCALSLLAGPASARLGGGTTRTATAAPVRPMIKLVSATHRVSIQRYSHRVYLDLGTYLVAGDQPFEIRATRLSYSQPIVASQVLPGGDVQLPPGLLRDFSGFPGFFRISLRDHSGALVLNRHQSFCPNGDAARIRPGASGTSAYPFDCPTGPFTLGSVWGIQAGWGVSTMNWNARPARLKLGTYTATVAIAPVYRNLFDIAGPDARATVNLRVVRGDNGCAAGCLLPRSERGGSVSYQPRASEPTGRAMVPAGAPLPDLRALPAYGIQIVHGNFLAFSATVWNGGPSPLVVDGFRRPHRAMMHAYQYFYDADGNEVGHAPAGTMEWDPRPGHMHWHFTDFARYRLLDADKSAVVRSRKEAFCLAATDAVDYTVPDADWRPYNTDLQTACGAHTAISVREVLTTGSGDTYGQWRPGQSLKLTDLPNGKYFIEVAANPFDRLHETSTDNNVAYRKVWIGGVPGARTVRVPPVGLIDAP